jgi:hypothetical protein
MGRNTAWGNKAYKEVRRNGGSKDEAREASNRATELYHQQTRERQFGKCGSHDNDVSDFNNSLNDGYWHTSDDL